MLLLLLTIVQFIRKTTRSLHTATSSRTSSAPCSPTIWTIGTTTPRMATTTPSTAAHQHQPPSTTAQSTAPAPQTACSTALMRTVAARLQAGFSVVSLRQASCLARCCGEWTLLSSREAGVDGRSGSPSNHFWICHSTCDYIHFLFCLGHIYIIHILGRTELGLVKGWNGIVHIRCIGAHGLHRRNIFLQTFSLKSTSMDDGSP